MIGGIWSCCRGLHVRGFGTFGGSKSVTSTSSRLSRRQHPLILPRKPLRRRAAYRGASSSAEDADDPFAEQKHADHEMRPGSPWTQAPRWPGSSASPRDDAPTIGPTPCPAADERHQHHLAHMLQCTSVRRRAGRRLLGRTGKAGERRRQQEVSACSVVAIASEDGARLVSRIAFRTWPNGEWMMR